MASKNAFVVLALCASSQAFAAVCAASPEAAARTLVGEPLQEAVTPSASGYRAQGLLIDPVLKKVWIRVSACAGAGTPSLLVPIASGAAEIAPTTPAKIPVSRTPAPSQRDLAVRTGEGVEIAMQTRSLRMTLHGTAQANASVGDAVDIALATLDGDGHAPHSLRARVVGRGMAEVLP